MNRQQKRKLNRENQGNTKNYGFSNKERNVIADCVGKIRGGFPWVSSIKPLTNPAPLEHDNYIAFRIGLATDIVYAIDCGTDYILKRYHAPQFSHLSGIFFVGSLLMRNILRRMSDLAFLWKNPQHTADYRDYQINSTETGDWARRLGITYKDKTEQGIIQVIEEIYGQKLTNDYFKDRADIFNDAFYGKHAIERYTELFSDSGRNEERMRKTKDHIILHVIDYYVYVDLILRGFQKYEQVTINNNPLDITKDTIVLHQLREQYQDQT